MPKILVVDDDPDFVLVCRTILEEAGYTVLEAANGRIALEIMGKDKPDLVLLDVMMRTILEGVDVSRELDADPELKQIPVIMVSSIASTEYAMDFPSDEAMPIETWISKPIQPTVLLRTIERFLG
jgi:CheY-like chemotaxis protein